MAKRGTRGLFAGFECACFLRTFFFFVALLRRGVGGSVTRSAKSKFIFVSSLSEWRRWRDVGVPASAAALFTMARIIRCVI